MTDPQDQSKSFSASTAGRAEPNEQQRRYREFLDLMPLMLSLAGLPASEGGRYYTDEQIQARLFTLKHAWKAARQLARECVQK